MNSTRTESNENPADDSSSIRTTDLYESRPELAVRLDRCEDRLRLLSRQKAASRSLLFRFRNEQVGGSFCQATVNLQIPDANDSPLRSQEFPLQLGLVTEPSLDDLDEEARSGISYVCSCCGALLYRIRPRGPLGTNPALQPNEVAARVGRCGSCGHVLNPQSELENIKISAFAVE